MVGKKGSKAENMVPPKIVLWKLIFKIDLLILTFIYV
jgi:hypothetical protein